MNDEINSDMWSSNSIYRPIRREDIWLRIVRQDALSEILYLDVFVPYLKRTRGIKNGNGIDGGIIQFQPTSRWTFPRTVSVPYTCAVCCRNDGGWKWHIRMHLRDFLDGISKEDWARFMTAAVFKIGIAPIPYPYS